MGAQGSRARPSLRALSCAAPDPRAQAVALAKYQVLAVYSAAGASWFKFESAAERLAWETAINERLLATEGKESQEEKAAAFKKLQVIENPVGAAMRGAYQGDDEPGGGERLDPYRRNAAPGER